MSSKGAKKRRRLSGDRKRSPTTRADAPKDWPEKIIGAKYVRLLEKQLRGLRDDTAHGNRQLFLDDVFVIYLLAFFNPTIRSLRTFEDLSQSRQAQKHLSIEKICKSTLSDFNKLTDPDRLVPIVQALHGQLNRKQPRMAHVDRGLNDLLKHTVAVDGTFLNAVAEVAWAVASSNHHGAVRHRARLDAFVNVSTWLPEAIVVPASGQSEADSAIKNILSGRIYVYDRGYSGFDLLMAHYEGSEGDAITVDELQTKAHFVVRYKTAGGNSPTLVNAIDRPLNDEDRAAGVVSDRVGHFTSGTARRTGVSKIPFREIIVHYEDKGKKKTLRLITNLMDVSAKTIALLYQHRWQVELFFRWFKSIANSIP